MWHLNKFRSLSRAARSALYGQKRRFNCYGDNSELHGLVLGVFGRDDEDSSTTTQTRVFTDSAEKYDKEVNMRLTEYLRVSTISMLYI